MFGTDRLGPEGGVRPSNRDALMVARPWAWRRLHERLPGAPRPEPVLRPGHPFTLQLADGTLLHAATEPAAEAEALVAGLRLEPADAAVVLGFGAGYVVEAVLAAAPTGCRVVAAVLDPGAFLVTLAHRDLPHVIADPRVELALGDLREIRAALPTRGTIVRVLLPSVAHGFAPGLAPLAAIKGPPAPGRSSTRRDERP